MEHLSLSSSLQNEIQTDNSGLPEKKIGSQGLRKKIVTKGLSWQTPFPGDEVEVHFNGYIEGGASLESSRDKEVPFKFKLGQGEVIKGWDEGVATMKSGERAVFTVPPNLAYGEAGSPPLIPPNATLVFDIEMLSWISIRDLTGDGGILKKIIMEGEGWATPRDGDEVLVKHETRLETGMLVSKSEEGVEFHVGDGYLCPALSRGVKTMRKGEKAELAVRLSYGFIQKGNLAPDIESNIPPDSSLTIQLELVSWRSVTAVTDDKKVLKKIVKAGEGFDRPTEGSHVKVTYVGKLGDGTVFDRKGTDGEPFEFITSEEQVNEGLDMAIMTMKKGERATVTVDAEFLHGRDISGKLPANSLLHYEVELLDFIKEKPFWKMDTLEKFEASERKKLDGNVLFKAGKFWRASKKYDKATEYIEFDHSFTDDEMCLAKSLRLSCHLNNAACKLKSGEYLEASRLCTKVLDLDPLNVKALFRRSQAYLKTSELEKAEADIKKALAIDPNNREVKLEYMELKEKQRKYNKYQAELFSTMVSKMS
ncbi:PEPTIDYLPROLYL ISOMERASE [Salix koriyanagi]|uniref:peptidylprolyl isomerase n=1 Tax=Salix koriyanagi TaxID=2511006 RepID=A0A9Q0ZUU9_9ROSI|nr:PEPTIDYLPROLYL ISOMERASE [Salix koriyanagi]